MSWFFQFFRGNASSLILSLFWAKTGMSNYKCCLVLDLSKWGNERRNWQDLSKRLEISFICYPTLTSHLDLRFNCTVPSSTLNNIWHSTVIFFNKMCPLYLVWHFKKYLEPQRRSYYGEPDTWGFSCDIDSKGKKWSQICACSSEKNERYNEQSIYFYLSSTKKKLTKERALLLLNRREISFCPAGMAKGGAK